MAKSPTASLQKWRDRMQNATQAMKDGVNAVTESPMEKAAANVDKYVQGVQDAAANGTFERGLREVSLGDWKTAMTEKGAANMANGVRSLTPRAQRAMTDLFQFADGVSSEIRSMPKVTETDSDNRMLANVRKFREYRKRR